MKDKITVQKMLVENGETKCDNCGKLISGNKRFSFIAKKVTDNRKMKTQKIDLCGKHYQEKTNVNNYK